MPTLIDKSGNNYDFTAIQEFGSTIELDGKIFLDGKLSDYTIVEPVTKVSPIQFKLLFTSAERIALKAAKDTDAALGDFHSIVDDPRLTFVDLSLQSTKDAVGYMAEKGYIDPARVSEILSGVFK
jgi:hypothetical protein